VWILDDLSPLQNWSQTAQSQVTFFAPRPAYRMWQWSPLNTFTDPKIPPNEFVGDNPDYGALLTYDLGRDAKSARIEIADESGRVVRTLTGDDVPAKRGVNRTSWDLNETGPVKWTGTFKENQGPDTGAEVVPGSYIVRLTVDGVVKTQNVTVKPDPRDPDLAKARNRRDYLAALFNDLGTIDTMLNSIDARMKHATGAQASALAAFKQRLTYGPRNIEDLSGPAQIREGVLDLISRASSSLQAPTEAQQAQAAAYKSQLGALSATYARL
jgi:hypothetical protein